MKELNKKIEELMVVEGYTIVEIMNALWAVTDEARISCIEDKVNNNNTIKYFETLSSILYSSYAQVRDLN